MPNPAPATATCHFSSCRRANEKHAMVLIPAPQSSCALEPAQRDSGPLSEPNTAIATSIGSISRPAPVTVAPNPYPEACGTCMSCGRKANTPNIAAPNSSATRLVVQTAGSRIIRMSISGLADRNSATSQPASSTTAVASRPSVRAEPQPQAVALLSGSNRATSQPDNSSAESQLIRPGVRTGDAGTKRQASTPTTTTTPIGIQNSQR